MAKRKRRVPRYQRDELARKKEAAREAEFPPDVILADLTQQAPNNSYGAVLAYRDYEFTCVDCGCPQVWTAAQQQWWYEVAKGSIYTRAVRCRTCRAARRPPQPGGPQNSP